MLSNMSNRPILKQIYQIRQGILFGPLAIPYVRNSDVEICSQYYGTRKLSRNEYMLLLWSFRIFVSCTI